MQGKSKKTDNMVKKISCANGAGDYFISSVCFVCSGANKFLMIS